MADSTCSVDGCERGSRVKGMCKKCYQRTWRQKRNPPKTTEQRFWAKVEMSDQGCWPWTGSNNGRGYGTLTVKSKRVYAHRYSFYLATGENPETVDHVCHNTLCVNPKHLRAATQKQNMEHRQGAQSNSKSGIRGVRWHDDAWEARVRHNRRDILGGRFATKEEAAEAVRRLRNELFTHNDLDRKPA